MIKSTASSCNQDLLPQMIEPKLIKPSLNKDLLLEVDSDTSSQKSLSDDKMTPPCLTGGVSNIKKTEDEGASLEKEDKLKVNAVRTQFYALNERFEQLLKFKPIRKLHLWHTEMNLESTYNIF